MGKKVNKVFLSIIVGCIFVQNTSILAAEKTFLEVPQKRIEVIQNENNFINTASNPALSACEVGVGIANNGLYITFDTTATQQASEIGVKNVVLQEKTWYGGWNDIPMNNYCTYNSDWYSGDVIYTSAKKGTTYRVKCTHYAKFGSTEKTMDNISSELTYN